MRQFEFEVPMTCEVRVAAEDGRLARMTLEAALDLATAVVRTGPGAGLTLGRLRVPHPPRLLSVDGKDPLADLEAALGARGARGRRDADPGGEASDGIDEQDSRSDRRPGDEDTSE